jgi:tRNA (adenine57-N1/adenine58-N1)-methyltransferase
LLERGWHVDERSVRPDHRMVAHTGFLTFARRTTEPVDAAPT